jgi:8-oxo-dGTP pyrophosphatase MutT (NUDIX family)
VVSEISAGGLVVEADRVALIARRSRDDTLVWLLPKGHVEPGETAEEAATREVEEETGIRGEIVAALGSIDYWFAAEGRRIHKTVHHFLLRRVAGELSDDDVEVERVEWVPLREAAARLAYPDERGLVERAAALLAGSG